MTSIVNRKDIPDILPPKRARPSLRQLVAAGLHRFAWPWSVKVVVFGFFALLVPVGEEVLEAASIEISATAHLMLAGIAFLGVVIYAMHKGTSDLK